jgi:hypothetical protein
VKAYIQKTLSGWKPADEQTAELWRKGKLGDVYHFEVKRVRDQRNWRHLQKYWVMLETVVENQEKYRTKEELHEAIKWELGIVETRRTMQGQMYQVIGSVGMASMDQEAFSRFYSDAINLILKYILTGTTEQELEERVMEVLSFAA